MQCYIAGPMRGITKYNFPRFFKAEEELTKLGWSVINPARVDKDMGIEFKEDQDWNELPEGMDLDDTIDRDLALVRTCDRVFVLPGWLRSRGGLAEVSVALWAGIEVQGVNADASQELEEFRKLTEKPETNILLKAYEITRGDRQAQYGPPAQDFTRTAQAWSALFGWDVRPDQVAAAMIVLKLSRQQHQRKSDNWVDIAGYSSCGSDCDNESEG